MSDDVNSAYADALAEEIQRDREKIERLDRVPQDGYWYVLLCGCKVAHIDGRFLHKPADQHEEHRKMEEK